MQKTNQPLDRHYDAVVVGAGSAGCVVAARLAADPGRRVLLLEAGPDYLSGDSWPPTVRSALAIAQGDDWGYTGRTGAPRPLPLRRGRLVGGSSAVNYCIALRSRPSDHAAWAARGLPAWSWDEVLPFYQALESDPAGDPRWHGTSGPTPIHRYPRAALSPSQQAFLDAAGAAGLGQVEDHNAPDATGAGITPRNQDEKAVRVNSALAYLTGPPRPNLTVVGDREVHSVVIEHGAAVGVRLADSEVVRADEVVISAGSYSSPKVLMLSGIGPAGHLREKGIEVVADLPGVGSDLIEHTSFPVVMAARAEDRDSSVPALSTTLTLRSSADEEDIDLHVQAQASSPTRAPEGHPTGYDFAMVVCLLRPESRGSVRLQSGDLADSVVIDTGIYSSPGDAERIARGVALARQVAGRAPLRDLLAGERMPGIALTGDDLVEAIRRMPLNYHHPVGTCRMGSDADAGAVVDESCQVRGVSGLSVIDASVIPDSPRATTHLVTLMVAERAVALKWPARTILSSGSSGR